MLCDFRGMLAWKRFSVEIENGIPKDVAKSIKRDRLIPLSRSITPKEFGKKIAALLINQIRNLNSVNKMHYFIFQMRVLSKETIKHSYAIEKVIIVVSCWSLTL